jgi:hypothetical protein
MLFHFLVAVRAEDIPEQAVRFAICVLRKPIDHGPGDGSVCSTGRLMTEDQSSCLNVAPKM